MPVLGLFVKSIAIVINMILELYMYVIIGRAILSWVSPDPYNPIVRFINMITDPVLDRIRSFLPSVQGIDFSPMVAIVAVVFLREIVVGLLLQLSQTLM
jgi:YggT family protein